MEVGNSARPDHSPRFSKTNSDSHLVEFVLLRSKAQEAITASMVSSNAVTIHNQLELRTLPGVDDVVALSDLTIPCVLVRAFEPSATA